MALQPAPDEKTDRQTTPPFLLRLFYRTSAFHSPSEFSTIPPSPSLEQSCVQVYTWPTCTLAELTSLLTSSLPDLLPSPAVGTRVGYRLLFPDTRSVGSGQDGPGRWLSKELGSVVIGATSEAEDEVNRDVLNNLQGDADKTLAEARFVIGDYISCAIFPPLANGSVAPLPPAERAGRSGGREGGYSRGGYAGRAENGYGGGGFRGGYGGRGGRGGFGGDRAFGSAGLPSGDWRRGERLPEGPGGGGYGRGRGRGRPY